MIKKSGQRLQKTAFLNQAPEPNFSALTGTSLEDLSHRYGQLTVSG